LFFIAPTQRFARDQVLHGIDLGRPGAIINLFCACQQEFSGLQITTTQAVGRRLDDEFGVLGITVRQQGRQESFATRIQVVQRKAGHDVESLDDRVVRIAVGQPCCLTGCFFRISVDAEGIHVLSADIQVLGTQFNDSDIRPDHVVAALEEGIERDQFTPCCFISRIQGDGSLKFFDFQAGPVQLRFLDGLQASTVPWIHGISVAGIGQYGLGFRIAFYRHEGVDQLVPDDRVIRIEAQTIRVAINGVDRGLTILDDQAFIDLDKQRSPFLGETEFGLEHDQVIVGFPETVVFDQLTDQFESFLGIVRRRGELSDQAIHDEFGLLGTNS